MNVRGNLSLARLLVLTAIIGTTGQVATAQTYPQKPIRWIVPGGPGGGTDFTARLTGGKLAEVLGQPVVVEFKPGAGGRIGTDYVAKAAPDGYTILHATGAVLIEPSLSKDVPYDIVKDFIPVTKVVDIETVLFAHPSVPAKTVTELVKYAKANPGALNFGSSGSGSIPHLTLEKFKRAAGIEMLHIPFKGGPDAVAALRGGQVQIALQGTTSSVGMVKAGQIIALAITSPKRSILLPNVPTMTESGYPGFESGSWNGVWLRAGTPRAIVTKLHAEIVRSLKIPEAIEQYRKAGLEPSYFESPDEFAKYVRAEVAGWARVIQAAGIERE